MNTYEIIEYILEPVIRRKDVFDIAINSGNGSSMTVDKWISVEMISALRRLKASGGLSAVEGERCLRGKKSSANSTCSLWWKDDDHGNWLEIKTIVFGDGSIKGDYRQIQKDLKKADRVSKKDEFYHLTFIFPIEEFFDDKELKDAYEHFSFEDRWFHKLWQDKYLLIVMYKNKR